MASRDSVIARWSPVKSILRARKRRRYPESTRAVMVEDMAMVDG